MGREKMTRTARYISNKLASQGFDGVVRVPAGSLDDMSGLHRLSSIGSQLKLPYDLRDIAAEVAGRDDIHVVCDSSVFDDQKPDFFWEALTDTPGKLVLTPRVQDEIRDWLGRRPHHKVANILDVDSTPANLLAVNEWSKAEQKAYVHYINLLALRKSTLTLSQWEFERKHGRVPNEADSEEVRSWVQRNLGERGMLFAKKGAQLPKPWPQTSYADEEVVYVAFALALKTGKPSLIYTKDEDLLDQFYRMLYLLDSHYRSMLIARAYLSDFGSYRTHPLPTGGAYEAYFKGANGILVERSESLPEDVLPEHFRFVPVSCHVLGDRLHSWMVFGAEQAMFEVLLTKGNHDGANSSLLLPRNCHLYLPGLDIPEALFPVFVIAEDRTISLSTGQKIPVIEGNQVLNSERFKLYEEMHPLEP